MKLLKYVLYYYVTPVTTQKVEFSFLLPINLCANIVSKMGKKRFCFISNTNEYNSKRNTRHLITKNNKLIIIILTILLRFNQEFECKVIKQEGPEGPGSLT